MAPVQSRRHDYNEDISRGVLDHFIEHFGIVSLHLDRHASFLHRTLLDCGFWLLIEWKQRERGALYMKRMIPPSLFVHNILSHNAG
jgi:hypothetical protein